MYLITISKYIFFLFHITSICLTFSLIQYWQVLILQLFVIISWKLNNNKCILTQIEYFLFKETIIDFYFKYIINKRRKYINYVVPKSQRYLLYLCFCYGSLYHIIQLGMKF